MKITNINDEFLQLLQKCGLPKYVGINGNPAEEAFEDNTEKDDVVATSTNSSIRKRKSTKSSVSAESL